jgi:hypothetical protein
VKNLLHTRIKLGDGFSMNAYLMLIAAIIFEVLGTMLLPASQSFTKTLPTIIFCP